MVSSRRRTRLHPPVQLLRFLRRQLYDAYRSCHDTFSQTRCPAGKCTIKTFSEEPAPIGHRAVRLDHHHLAVGVGEAQYENLGPERPDLLGREVGHGGDLPADQFLRGVVVGDLGRALALADLGAEIHEQLVGGLARLGEGLDPSDGADADVDLQEVIETDLGHALRGGP